MRAEAAEERAQSERRWGGKLKRLQNLRNHSVDGEESWDVRRLPLRLQRCMMFPRICFCNAVGGFDLSCVIF